MNRHWYKPYFAVWEDLPNDIIWMEAGKDWADGLINGNWFERQARKWMLGFLNPLFALGIDFVLAHYRDKLIKHIGPNGIWVAIKLPMPPNLIPRCAAKKRDKSNFNTKKVTSHPPTPWVPEKWNVV